MATRERQQAGYSIHPGVDVGMVTLKVASLERSVEFYTQMIGLKVLRQKRGGAVLGAGARAIVALEEVSGARPLVRNATGLYHAAILFPDRHALAVKISQLAKANYPYGYSDHLVSEAFYLDDPDANGLELYRDRPRADWGYENGQIKMGLDPIDFDSFFGEVKDGDPALKKPAAPDGTRLGHMHLRVGNLAEAEAFYHGVLGLDIMARMPGALFLSAGGYHHHLGMNTWESRGAKPPEEPSAGLREFSLVLPDRSELERLVKQVGSAGVKAEWEGETALLRDPFENRVRLLQA
jgi:catechol 2,3-dioxygenase